MDFHHFPGYPPALKLAAGCSKAADMFPRTEQFALAQQLRRAAYSVVLNIPEAFCRIGTPSLRHYLNVSYTSANEVAVILELARQLGYIGQNLFDELMALQKEVARRLLAFLKSLRG